MIKEIVDTIKQAIPGAEVHILDPMNDGIHLQALVISSQFIDLPLFKQHQLVMQALTSQFDSSLHALGLKTFTPEKWEQKKDQFQLGGVA